jgi:hypothetical protein
VNVDNVLPSSAVSAGPKYIVAVGAKRLDIRPRKVLASEQAHLRWNRIGLVFVGHVTGVGQAGEKVVSRQSGIVCQEIVLRLAGRKEFEYEFDGQMSPSDHRLAGQDLGIY